MKKKSKEQADQYTYTANDGRVFIQQKLVLAQMEQFVENMRDVVWPDFKEFNLLTIYEAIGPRLPVALAIMLSEKDKDPREKDLVELSDYMRFNFPLDEGIRAVKDFFLLNPTASIAASLRDLMGAQAAMKAVSATGSPTSS